MPYPVSAVRNKGSNIISLSSLLSGLASYWKLDETSGNRVDSVGSRTMVPQSTTSYGTGKIGNALDLVATGYLLCNDNTLNVDATNGFTICGWIYLHATGANSCIFRLGAGGTDMAVLTASSDNKAQMYVVDSATGVSSVKGSDTLTTDTWYFLCGRYNPSTKKAEVSLNAGAFALGAALTNGPKQGATSSLIGRWPANNANGLIDEVGVWTRYLSDTEVSALYNGGTGTTYPF